MFTADNNLPNKLNYSKYKSISQAVSAVCVDTSKRKHNQCKLT